MAQPTQKKVINKAISEKRIPGLGLPFTRRDDVRIIDFNAEPSLTLLFPKTNAFKAIYDKLVEENQQKPVRRRATPRQIRDSVVLYWRRLRDKEVKQLLTKVPGRPNITDVNKFILHYSDTVNDRHIRLDNIPPLISQIPIQTYLHIMTNEYQIDHHLSEIFSNTFFKIPQILSTMISNLHFDIRYTILMRVMVINFHDEYPVFIQELISADNNPADKRDVDAIWKILVDKINELTGKYQADIDELSSIWVKRITISTDLHNTHQRLDQVYNKIFSLLPNTIAVRYGKYPSLISCGMCGAEAYWWITQGYRLLAERHNRQYCQTKFVDWIAGLSPEDLEGWCSGETSWFLLKIVEVQKPFLVYVPETMAYIYIRRNEDITHEFDKFKPTDFVAMTTEQIERILNMVWPRWREIPIFIISNFHVFQLNPEHLVKIIRVNQPRTWASKPINPRDYFLKKTKKQPSDDSDDEESKVREVNINCYFDIECYNTDIGVQLPYILVLVRDDMEEPIVFTKKNQSADVMEDFRQYLVNEMIVPYQTALRDHVSRKTFTIWSHNGSGYDWRYLFNDWFLGEVMFIGSQDKMKGLIIHNITFTDFYLLMSASLNTLAKSWLKEEKFDHVDFSKITSESYPDYMEEMVVYCVQDVRLLQKIVQAFIKNLSEVAIEDEETGITFKPNLKHLTTAASLAWNVWKTCFNTYTVYPCPKEFYPHVKDSYYGGVCYNSMTVPDFSQFGEGYCYDVNSMYPAAMKENIPIKADQAITFTNPVAYKDLDPPPPNMIRQLWVTSWSFANHVENHTFALRFKDGLYYIRNNTNPTWRWEAEVDVAKDDCDFQIGGYILWHAAPIFSTYVDYWYSLKAEAKKQGDACKEASYKLYLNTLYGKSAQKQNHVTIFDHIQNALARVKLLSTEPLNNTVKSVARIYGDWVLVKTQQLEEVWHVGANLEIAAYITAVARGILYKVERQYQGKIFYRDTDSVHMSCPLPPELVSSSVLGKLKLEYTIATAVYLSAKVYYIKTTDGKEIFKAKGVPKKFLTREFYFDDDNEVKYSSHVGPMLQMHNFENSKVCKYVTKVVTTLNRRREWEGNVSYMFNDVSDIHKEHLRRTQLLRSLKKPVTKTNETKLSTLLGSTVFATYPIVEPGQAPQPQTLTNLVSSTKEWCRMFLQTNPHANIDQLLSSIEDAKNFINDITIKISI
jgi:hypothetical protein